MNSKFTKLYFIIRGKYKHIKRTTNVSKKWYGNRGGGFYVAHKLLDSKSIVYSFGVGEDISFDRTIVENYGCQVFAFYPTPKSINWCRNQVLPSNFNLYEFGIAACNGVMKFHLPRNKEHVSGSLVTHKAVSNDEVVEVQMKSFTNIVSELGHSKIDLLKMDIEGSEYDVIEGILDSGIEIKQIAIEFHERFFDKGKQKTIELIRKMEERGYAIFGISDIFEEVSFVKV